MRNKVSLSILLVFVLVNSFGQQSRLKKVSLTKIGKEKKKATAQSIFYSELKSASGSEFKKEKTVTDKRKNNHETYQQYYQGIKVEYGQIKVHKKNGELTSYNGNYYDVSSVNTSPRISKSSAISIAEKFMGNSFFWPGKEVLKKEDPEITLVILPNRRTGVLNLAYAITVGASKPELKMGILYVNASDGTILKFKNQLFACFEETSVTPENFVEKPTINTTMATGSGYAAYTGSVNFETKLDGSDYILNDETRALSSTWNLSTQGLGTKTGIITVDIRNGTDYVNGPLYEFTDGDNNWTPAEMITDDNVYAIDAHWGTEMLYDYWKNEHGWESYNGANSSLLSIIHYDSNLTNAAWAAISDTSGFMLYGDGGGSYSPLTTLDVVAHEIAHGINNATSNLDYEYESGALNEGLSDIWAMVFENYANDNLGTSTDPSRINDQNAGGALRSFSNPNAYDQPDTYGGTNWYDTTNCTPSKTGNDYCGVHTNSGVLNYWFWLLYNGGSGTNDIGNSFSVTGISVYDAADIVWQMQTNYLTSTSDYADARSGAIQAATDLFGDCSQQLKSVTNAFHAVGVGDAYVEIVPTITTQPENITVEANNGTAQFTVVAENYTAVTWEESTDGADTWSSISDGSMYSGSATTTLTVTNPPESNDLYYRAIVSNDCGSTTSNEVNLLSITYTLIPDANFEAKLEALGYDDISGDGKIPTQNINTLTSLNVSGSSISDLTGIEDFSSLESLNIKSNSISTIDISNNVYLKNFSAQDNSLTAVDVSKNTSLEILGIARNSITSLDFSNNTLLSELYAASNAITSLDLSKNPNLKIVGLNPNELTSLNIQNGNNTAITTLAITGNANLTCVLVDDASYSAANWTTIDEQTSFSDVSCYTEYTAIPDSNFESALEALGYDDISGDGQVPTELIAEVTYLNVSNKNISDITGIEDFVALDDFYVDQNTITSIDMSSNTALKYIFCQNNNLTSLNVTANTLLEVISCDDNSLTSVDFSNNPLLNTIQVSNNPITVLDVSNQTALTQLNADNTNLIDLDLSNNSTLWEINISNTTLTSLNLQNGNNSALTDVVLTNNPSLECVLVDDAAYSTTNWVEVDTQISFSDTGCYTEYTSIPDSNFEAALEALGYDDISGDGQVPTALIENVTSLNLSGSDITDLTGIQDFIGLYTLNVSNMSINSIDVSALVKLTSLGIRTTNISAIDVSNLTNLEVLQVHNNNLTTLDLSNNDKITFLYVRNNQLTSLDVSHLTQLEILRCRNNNIESLDLSNASNLEELDCDNNALTSLNLKNGNNSALTSIDAVNNSNLACVVVDDVTYSNTNWSTYFDNTVNFSDTYCEYTQIPDSNFEAALEALGYDDISGDGQVPTELIENVTTLSVGNKNISDFTGIEGFSSIKSLYVHDNPITTINLSNNLNLSNFRALRCNLTSLDLSANTSLTYLDITDNDLTELNLANNVALTTLVCPNNQISVLDVSSITVLEELEANNNLLTTLTLGTHDNLAALLLDNNELTELDLSAYPNLEYVVLNDNNLTALNLQSGSNQYIYDFDITNNPNLTCVLVDDAIYSATNWTNIDAQSNFSDTYCEYTQISDSNFEAALEALGYDDISGDGQVPTSLIEGVTSLNVNNQNISDATGLEGFIALEQLYIKNNNLSVLDVSNNSNLNTIWAVSNNLTTIDLSSNPLLTDVRVEENQLTSVDFSQLTQLKILQIDSNQLETIDLSNCTLLERIRLNNNKLTELDFSNHPNISEFNVELNNLTSLNVQNGNNANITSFAADFNENLTCIQVDDVDYSSTNWTNIDSVSSFSQNCDSCVMNVNAILEGAYNSTASEMNDTLRSSSLIPTTSPYEDGLTCESSLFDNAGTDAIVDWVEIQLRNANDITEIVERKSFLLGKNNTVVDADGNSELTINAWHGEYYVAISHRNHLTVVTSVPINLNGTAQSIDFTVETNVLNGANALVEVASSIFALPAGDVNESGQIQNSGISSTILQVGISGYSIYDVDMNGQVQNTDLTIIQQNIGKGEQF